MTHFSYYFSMLALHGCRELWRSAAIISLSQPYTDAGNYDALRLLFLMPELHECRQLWRISAIISQCQRYMDAGNYDPFQLLFLIASVTWMLANMWHISAGIFHCQRYMDAGKHDTFQLLFLNASITWMNAIMTHLLLFLNARVTWMQAIMTHFSYNFPALRPHQGLGLLLPRRPALPFVLVIVRAIPTQRKFKDDGNHFIFRAYLELKSLWQQWSVKVHWFVIQRLHYKTFIN